MILFLFLFYTSHIKLLFAEGQTECKNGGFLNDSGGCNCYKGLWIGDSCETIVCLNGGYINPENQNNDTCVCPVGYFGTHCDAVPLITPPQKTFSGKVTKTFNVFLINIFSDNWGTFAFQNFKDATNRHLTDNPTYYDQFNLYQTTNDITAKDNMDDPKFPDLFTWQSNTVDNSNDFLKALPKSIHRTGNYRCYPVPLYSKILELIKKENLHNTAITIVTQHPGMDDAESVDQIQKIASAFSIRINVIWCHDEIYVRCSFSDSTMLVMQSLSRNTGGYFSSFKTDTSVPNAMDVTLSSHVAYQGVAMAASSDTQKQPLKVSFLPYPNAGNIYYLDSTGLNSDGVGREVCSSYLAPPIVSYHFHQSFYKIIGNNANCTLKSSASEGEASLRLFTQAGATDDFRLFYSFVEDKSIDSSMTQPLAGSPSYLAFHIVNENNDVEPSITSVAVRASDGDYFKTALDIPRTKSTFELITNDAYKCNATSASWWWYELTLQMPNGYYESVLPFNCYTGKSSLDGDADDSSISKLNYQNKVVEDDLTHLPLENEVETSCNKTFEPSFSIFYANDLKEDVRGNFFKASVSQVVGAFYPYGEIIFQVDVQKYEASTSQAWDYYWQTNYDDFYNNIYTVNKVDPDMSTGSGDQSQLFDALEKLATNALFPKDGGLIAIADTRLPYNDKDISTDVEIQRFVDRNVKIVLFMDVQDFTNQLENVVGRSAKTLNQIATATNGHFIVSDEINTDFQATVSAMYSNSAGQTLVFSSSFNQITSNFFLGSLDLSSISKDVTLSLSLTTEVNAVADLDVSSAQISIVFVCQNCNPAVAPVRIILQNTANSNLFTNSIVLSAGKYDMKLFNFGLPGIYRHLRIWRPNGCNNFTVNYADLDNKVSDGANPTSALIYPDNKIGAAIRASIVNSTVSESDTMTAVIRDCMGTTSTLSGSTQTVKAIENEESFKFYFAPFFCQLNTDYQCAGGLNNLYTVTLTSSTGDILTRNFLCHPYDASPTDPVPIENCKNKDDYGNYICGGITPPYYAGPTSSVLDCSQHGHLVYNINYVLNDLSNPLYKCQCDEGFEGNNCEIALCAPANTAAGTLDDTFRSYTIIVAATKDTKAFVAADAITVVNLDGPIDGVWLYQILFLCADGTIIRQYLSPEYFADLSSELSAIQAFCGEPSTTGLDLTTAITEAVMPLGRNEAGLIVLFTEDVPSLTVDQASFIEIAQQYRQRFYIYGFNDESKPTDLSTIQKMNDAVQTTGGAALYSGADSSYEPDVDFPVDTILRAKISLNVHETIGAVLQNQPFTFTTENKTIVIITGLKPDDGYQACISTKEDCSSARLDADGFSKTTSLAAGKYFLSANSKDITDPLFVSVLVMNGVTPTMAVLSDGSKDATTALPVSYTKSGPLMAISTPSGSAMTKNEDDKARVNSREDCTFSTSTYALFQPLSPGNNALTIEVNISSTLLKKVFPFGVSAKINCMNGGTPSATTGVCICPANFEGPLCTSPVCHGGILSQTGNACNCINSGGTGRFCENVATTEETTMSFESEEKVEDSKEIYEFPLKSKILSFWRRLAIL